MTEESEPKLPEGWYASLQGDEVDRDDWCHSLNEPFDPVATKLPSGETVLASAEFQALNDAHDVRERALVLIGRLNGAIALWNGARPLRFGGVIRIDSDGKLHRTIFGEAAIELRVTARATGVVIGSDGKPKAPPPPTPSQPQSWNALAQTNDAVSEMLDHFGRADNWYDIYKTIECCEDICGGGEAHLLSLVGDRDRARLVKRLKTTANSYRHNKARGSPRSLTLRDARLVLAEVVRAALTNALDREIKAVPAIQ